MYGQSAWRRPLARGLLKCFQCLLPCLAFKFHFQTTLKNKTNSRPPPPLLFCVMDVFSFFDLLTHFPRQIIVIVEPGLQVKNRAANSICSNCQQLDCTLGGLSSKMSLSPFVKPHAILNLAVQNVVFVQSTLHTIPKLFY